MATPPLATDLRVVSKPFWKNPAKNWINGRSLSANYFQPQNVWSTHIEVQTTAMQICAAFSALNSFFELRCCFDEALNFKKTTWQFSPYMWFKCPKVTVEDHIEQNCSWSRSNLNVFSVKHTKKFKCFFSENLSQYASQYFSWLQFLVRIIIRMSVSSKLRLPLRN